MKEIKLTQGKVALVDDEDYERVMSIGKWHVSKCKGTFYATTTIRENGEKHTIYMHRFIMGLSPGDRLMVDHKFGDTFDNQKYNLRFCTKKGNARNQKIKSLNKSGYKGVDYYKKTNKWRAQIRGQESKKIHLGFFLCPIEAARAYNEAAIKYHGEFARLNEIPA